MTNHDPEARILGSQSSPFREVATERANPAVLRTLQRTQPWARLIGIVGLVIGGLHILIVIGGGGAMIATGNADGAGLLAVVPLIALFFIFPSLYLVRYANRIRDFVTHGQQSQLEAALEAQRSFWKFIGIVTLVYLVLIGLALLILMVVPLLVR
jgi:hypothetical protein